jgi:hypothetical protein
MTAGSFPQAEKRPPNRGQELSTESVQLLLRPEHSGIYCFEQIPEEEH